MSHVQSASENGAIGSLFELGSSSPGATTLRALRSASRTSIRFFNASSSSVVGVAPVEGDAWGGAGAAEG